MERKKLKTDIIVSSILIVFCVLLYFVSIPNQISLKSMWESADSKVNSRTLPYFAVVLMAGSSLFQLVKSIIKYRKIIKTEEKETSEKNSATSELRALLVFACCILYAVLLKYIGYMVATLISTTLMLVILKDYKIKHYIIVFAVGVLMYFVFRYLLNVRLP